LFNYLQITLGRTTKDQAVDVDLKLEGPAWKISRKQGVIKLRNSGEFFIANEGKRSFFVDGKPVKKVLHRTMQSGCIISWRHCFLLS
jgi:microspherule protein 1